MEQVPILNASMDLADCAGRWTFDETYHCWCLEDVLYTPAAKLPAFQRLSIFAPKELVNADGTIPAAARSVPVVFANNAAGYMQMPHTWLGGPRFDRRYGGNLGNIDSPVSFSTSAFGNPSTGT